MEYRLTTRFALQKTEIGKGLDITSGAKRVQYRATTDFTLGAIPYVNEKMLIDPDSTNSDRYRQPEIVGILGIDLLWKMDLELDLGHRKLNLYEPRHCAVPPVYWAGQYGVVPLQRDAFGEFYFPMELDGKKLEAMLTTSSSVTTLSTDVTKRVYGFDRDSPDVESTTDASGKTTSQYRAMTLTAAGLSVANEKVQLIDPPHNECRLAWKNHAVGYTNCFYLYPLRLGSGVLERLHVYIATQDSLLYFTGDTEETSP